MIELILLKPIKNLGSEGDVVRVRDGYARNFLLPKKLASRLTAADIHFKDSLKKKGEQRKIQELSDLKAVAQRLSQVELNIPVKTGAGNKLFGAVTSLDIAKALENLSMPIERKKIILEQPIKVLGNYSVTIKLHKDVEATIKVSVVKEAQEEKPSEVQTAEAAASEEKTKIRKKRSKKQSETEE